MTIIMGYSYSGLSEMENLKQQASLTFSAQVDAMLAAPLGHTQYKPLLVQLFQSQQLVEAERLLRFVIAKNPADFFAQQNLIQALTLLGRLPEAEQAALSALDLHSDAPELYVQLSQTLQLRGQMDHAVLAAQEALAKKPEFEPALLKLAELYLNSAGKLEKAETTIKQLIARNPAHPSAYGLLGIIYLKLRKFDEAEATVRRSLEINPHNGATYANLSLVQCQLGKLDEAEIHARKAVSLTPQFHKVHSQLGHVLYLKGQLDAAEAALNDSLKITQTDFQTHMALSAVYLARGNKQVAFQLLDHILAQTRNIDFYHQLVYAMWPILQNPGFAHFACNVSLRVRPGASEALAIQCVTLNDLGERDMLGKLSDFDRLVKARRLPVPQGFADLESFNYALTETIRNASALKFEPVGKAIIGGYRLQPMGEDLNLATAALYRMIRETITEVGADLAACAQYPFLQQKPANYSLQMWGNIHHGQGYEFAHYHPDGWISGVYYPKLPAITREDTPEKQAWIEFGRPREDIPFKRDGWQTKAVRPEEGLLILFPSYMWHRTMPYTGGDERVSIAFDVLPLA